MTDAEISRWEAKVGPGTFCKPTYNEYRALVPRLLAERRRWRERARELEQRILEGDA